MIVWLNAAALVGLAAAAGPLLVHLLRQPRAARVPFPTLRFVEPSRPVAARMRRIADPWLLLLRMGIVALVALALAQPVFVTPGRLEAWNGRTARAIVVDASESMRRDAADTTARELAAAEAGAAFTSTIVDAVDLREGIGRASAWIAAAPPARREIVIISDFHHGALPAGALERLPEPAGIRLRQVGEAAAGPRFRGMRRFAAGQAHDVRLTAEGTQVTLVADPSDTRGLRFLSGGDREPAALVRAVAAAGAPAPSAGQPLALAFGGIGVPPSVQSIPSGWMLATLIRLAGDRELRQAAARTEALHAIASEDAWYEVAADRHGRPIVRAAAAGAELVIDTAAAPGDYLSAAVLRGALLARHGSPADPEQEVVRAGADRLAALERSPAEVGAAAAHHAEASDARWLWLLALLLLAIETRARRSPPARVPEVRADAA